MTSKASVTLNVLLVSLAILIWNRGMTVSDNAKLYLYPKESLLNFTEITNKYGYVSEEHDVITDDGYILTIFRIVKGNNCKQRLRKPPVILMHGLLQSADAWLDAGPDAGLAYLISDSCFDLWVGNQRGNYYSRRHNSLNPDRDAEFWDFSIDEIGLYDIPATIDYVLKYTGQPKVNYIGYSQGTGTFLIMCSERPGYCDKVSLLIGLAPAARQVYTKSVPYRTMCEGVMYLEKVFSASGYFEVFPKKAISQEFLAFVCQFQVMNGVCETIDTLIDSYHPGSISNDTLRVMFNHFPAGTSLKNIVRYGQSMRSYKFQKFDYGKENARKYGTVEPPSYNLSAVTVPFVTLYGKNDYLVDTKDVLWLVKKIPNVVEARAVEDPLWNHLDSTYSQYSNEMIFSTVHKYLLQYSVS